MAEVTPAITPATDTPAEVVESAGKSTNSKSKKPSRWLKPSEAVALLAPSVHGIVPAKEHIADALKDGTIVARTKQHWKSSAAQLADAWAERHDVERRSLMKISTTSWRLSCDWSKDTANWNWESGRFFVTKRDGRQPERRMFGSIRFHRDELKQLAKALKAKDRTNVGGRRPDFARWTELWQCAVAVVADQEAFRKLKNPSALSEAIREAGHRRWPKVEDEDRFGRDNRNSVASAVWQALREPWFSES